MVVLTSRCPSSSWIVRMSYPASSRWVAKLCLSELASERSAAAGRPTGRGARTPGISISSLGAGRPSGSPSMPSLDGTSTARRKRKKKRRTCGRQFWQAHSSARPSAGRACNATPRKRRFVPLQVPSSRSTTTSRYTSNASPRRAARRPGSPTDGCLARSPTTSLLTADASATCRSQQSLKTSSKLSTRRSSQSGARQAQERQAVSGIPRRLASERSTLPRSSPRSGFAMAGGRLADPSREGDARARQHQPNRHLPERRPHGIPRVDEAF